MWAVFQSTLGSLNMWISFAYRKRTRSSLQLTMRQWLGIIKARELNVFHCRSQYFINSLRKQLPFLCFIYSVRRQLQCLCFIYCVRRQLQCLCFIYCVRRQLQCQFCLRCEKTTTMSMFCLRCRCCETQYKLFTL